MLVHDFAYVAAPVGWVRRHLEAGATSWLTDIARGADGDGAELRLKLGRAGLAPLLGKSVRIVCEPCAQRGDTTVVPLTWHAEGMEAAFPTLVAYLEVAPFGDERTQITLMGRYDPPLGAVGRRLDRVLGHRVAEATVRDFLSRVARALEEVPSVEPQVGLAVTA